MHARVQGTAWELYEHTDNTGSGSTGRRLRFERNSNSTERSYPRPKRTGIIITLLPISSETMCRERAGGAGGRKEEQPGHSEGEKESDQDASDEDTGE